MKLLRLGLLLTWFLLIATSHDEPQSKAIQLMACLMEMLSSTSRPEWTR
jgi:hypothetical protein